MLSIYYIQLFLNIYAALCILQMTFPFLHEPYCPWSSAQHGNGVPYSQYLQYSTASIDMLCVMYFTLDLVATIYVLRRDRKMFRSDIWLLVRLLCCILLFMESILRVTAFYPFDFARSVVPIILISRRKSLRLIMLGVFRATRKCIPLFLFLFTLLFIWSYMGYLIFNNVDTNGQDHFSSLLKSLRTCVMCFTAAGYPVFALDPYFKVNPISSLFFVSLVAVSCILTAPIIISVGNREYRSYADEVFRHQLRNRKEAIVAVHQVLSDISGIADSRKGIDRLVSRETWLSFCYQLKTKFKINSQLIDMMFDTEALPAGKDEVGVDCAGVFRLCALLDSRFNLDSRALGGGELAMSDDEKGNDGIEEERVSMWARWSFADENFRLSTISNNPRNSSSPQGIEMGQVGVKNPIHIDGSSSKTLTFRRPESRSKGEPRPWHMWACHRILLLAEYIYLLIYVYAVKSRSIIKSIVSFNVPLTNLFCCEYSVNALNACASICRVVLAIQLFMICNVERHQGWYVLGWGLQLFFCIEVFFRCCAEGLRKYISRTYALTIAVNLASLTLMILISRIKDDEKRLVSAPFIALIIVQCSRFFTLFGGISETSKIVAVAPLFLRVCLIIFCTIYFFAVFAYNRFCNILRPEEAQGNDDVAPNWIQYEDQLNFDTFPKSLYTLFEIATFGDWTVVQVAEKVDPISSYLFFYTYRLLMTLVFLPILSSFIIQTFVSRRETIEKTKTTENARDHVETDASVISSDDRTPKCESENATNRKPEDGINTPSETLPSVTRLQLQRDKSAMSSLFGDIDTSNVEDQTNNEVIDVIRHSQHGNRTVDDNGLQMRCKYAADTVHAAVDCSSEGTHNSRRRNCSDDITTANSVPILDQSISVRDIEKPISYSHRRQSTSGTHKINPGRRPSRHPNRRVSIGITSDPVDSQSMISFWSASGTERLMSDMSNKYGDDAATYATVMQLQLNEANRLLVEERERNEALAKNLKELKKELEVLTRNLSLTD